MKHGNTHNSYNGGTILGKALMGLAGAAMVMGLSLPAQAASKWVLKGRVNINEAPEKVLVLLPGIGPSKAKAIVRYRKARKFRNIKQIRRIKGIGWKTYKRLRKYLRVSGPTDLRRVKEGGQKAARQGAPLGRARTVKARPGKGRTGRRDRRRR